MVKWKTDIVPLPVTLDLGSCGNSGGRVLCTFSFGEIPKFTVNGADIYVAPKPGVIAYAQGNHYGNLGDGGRLFRAEFSRMVFP